MAVLFVAEKLGKLPCEIEESFTPYDLAEFLAYQNIVAEEREAQLNKRKKRK